MQRAPVAPPRVEFSDTLIVLGPSSPRHSPAQSLALPPSPPVVKRAAAESDPRLGETDPPRPGASGAAAAPDGRPVHAAPAQLHIPPSDVVLRPPPKRKVRVSDGPPPKPAEVDVRDEESLETSCTDSDASASDPATAAEPSAPPVDESRRMSSQRFAECTRINTKLNSLPSGGAFSFMNSSEDVNSVSRASSYSSSDLDEQVRSSRRMIRVDGSAKLSSASGLGDEDLFGEDDEFGIEGAERVDEEEDVHVRSFGRSFAKVSLADGTGDDIIIPDPRRTKKQRSEVSFDVPESEGRPKEEGVTGLFHMDEDDDTYHDMFSSKSSPSGRKSKIRITFTRRSSNASSIKKSGEGPSRRRSVRRTSDVQDESIASGGDDDSDTEFGGISCFPSRRSVIKQRTRTSLPEPRVARRAASHHARSSATPGTGRRGNVSAREGREVVSIPDMTDVVNAERKGKDKGNKGPMVKNVSLQRDDWIDFATNAATRQKHSWLVRLVSSNGTPSTPSSSPSKRNSTNTASTTATRASPSKRSTRRMKRSSRSFWKWFSRK